MKLITFVALEYRVALLIALDIIFKKVIPCLACRALTHPGPPPLPSFIIFYKDFSFI